MAGPAENGGFSESQELEPLHPVGPGAQIQEMRVNGVKLAVAKLYGQGFSRRQVMLRLLDHLAPAERPGKRDRTKEERHRVARTKLRQWERQDKFRQLVYDHAVIELDLDVPKILKGVSNRAQRGRVDAARLALEVTGRHNPKGDQQAPNITVQIANIPRPGT